MDVGLFEFAEFGENGGVERKGELLGYNHPMYHSLTVADIRRILKVPDSYKVDHLIVAGTNSRPKEHPYLYEALERIGRSYKEEVIEDSFFGEIKSLVVAGKRIWFDVAYGTAYLSEVVHVASMLGSQANILIGSCGALNDTLISGDTIIPTVSFGNESSTRMYQRENNSFLYFSDKKLSSSIEERVNNRKTVVGGKLMTVQAMLAETKEDVDLWNKEGYIGVDMESATVFAVSGHFNVPAAALLYVADNLIKNELVTDGAYQLLRPQRIALKKGNYESVLRMLIEE